MTLKRTALRLRDAPPKDPDYIYNDVQRIVKVLHERGFTVAYRAAKEAWAQHSADTCASWLTLPGGVEGDELIADILLNGTDDGSEDAGFASLNGRAPGPFLVSVATGEPVKYEAKYESKK